MKRYNNIQARSDKNMIVCCGATGAFYSACLALLNLGDEVIIFEPYYGYHINTFLAVGAKPVFVRLIPPDWGFDFKRLKKYHHQENQGYYD